MAQNSLPPSLQDYSLIKTHVDALTRELALANGSLAFMFFALELILGLQEDELEDALTDTAYLNGLTGERGHDRGIDAVYIEESETPATVHLFNFKYTEQFKKMGNHFPSNEIDKITGFLSGLMQQDEQLQSTVNRTLASKISDIWSLYSSQNPKFVIHICANLYNGFEPMEQQRFKREIDRYSSFQVEYHLVPWLVARLTQKGKHPVNARIRAIDRNLFEKSDGDIRALIVDVDVRDLLRIVMDNEEIRQAVDISDYSVLQHHEILEDAFEDNVRIYLKQRSKINRNIKETALSDEAHRFFYFNNGITITCAHFDYPKQRRSPIIELEDLQVVNGSQTIHALLDAFKENLNQFDNMDILCRIYETRNSALSIDIAEYTNSQNPVKSRDIRSNDYVQKKLEKELEALGYFYERKRGQYSGKPKTKRMDAEKIGQALLAFQNKMPAEAKDAKRIIFAEKYDDIFSDTVTADVVLLVFNLYNEIETRKLKRKKEILVDPSYEAESFILHASYYILYVISELAELRNQEKCLQNYSLLMRNYEQAVDLVRRSIDAEKSSLEGYKENYTHRMFFKGNRPKIHLDSLIKTSDPLRQSDDS